MEAMFDSLLANDTPERTDTGRVSIKPLYGGSKRAVRDMSVDELAAISDGIMAKVREQAFSQGLPIVYEQNGQTIREYADGRLDVVTQ